MFNRNFFLVLIYFFLVNCGFTPLYKDIKNIDFSIEIDKAEGNETINNFIKLNLKNYTIKNKTNKKLIISLNSNYYKNTVAKNISGISTEYELVTDIEFTIKYGDKTKKINFTEKINLKNLNNTFDEINYEKSYMNNSALIIVKKLILELVNLDDF